MSVVVIGAGLAIAMAMVGKNQAASGASSAAGVAPIAAADADSMIWDDVGGPPVTAVINGKEAVLGRLRSVRGGDELFIVASDAQTLARHWKAGPYGTYSEGYQCTHFVVTGENVITSDFHSRLHFLQLSTGKELATLALTDRVECLSVESTGKVRVDQADDRAFLLDPAARTMTTVPDRNKRKRWELPCYKRKSVERKALPAASGPHIEGFETLRVLIDGNEGIAAGKKAPGTPLPQVVGFEPGTKRALWRQMLPSVDPNTVDASSELAGAIAGHRYVGVYPVGTENHRLTAFDSRSGARLWDVKLRGLFAVDRIDDIILTEQYVYAVRTSSLDVLEAKSGRLIGAIGTDTYDKDE